MRGGAAFVGAAMFVDPLSVVNGFTKFSTGEFTQPASSPSAEIDELLTRPNIRGTELRYFPKNPNDPLILTLDASLASVQGISNGNTDPTLSLVSSISDSGEGDNSAKQLTPLVLLKRGDVILANRFNDRPSNHNGLVVFAAIAINTEGNLNIETYKTISHNDASAGDGEVVLRFMVSSEDSNVTDLLDSGQLELSYSEFKGDPTNSERDFQPLGIAGCTLGPLTGEGRFKYLVPPQGLEPYHSSSDTVGPVPFNTNPT